ncbi:MAG: hypothetical protein ACOX19_07085 [Fermentimonas sp.]
MNGAYLHVGAPVYVGNGATRQRTSSEHTFLIDVTNYSVLRHVLHENGYFDLC